MTLTVSPVTPVSPPSALEVAQLLTALQSQGLRVEVPLAARAGGAGPADAGMLYVEGVPTTVPTAAAYVADSPYVLRGDDDGSWGVYAAGVRLASASLAPRPRYYELTTADGIPYSQIALLHLDSVASTVLQTCAYWGNADQCTFCGIGVTLAQGRTIAKKTPAMLAEVALAAKELDGAVDATLTTGSTATPDRGAMYVARCGEAVKAAAGRPRRHRPGRRDGHRLGRHPRRDLRPGRACPGRAGQGALGHRGVLLGLGASRRGVRGRPGVDVRHPRDG